MSKTRTYTIWALCLYFAVGLTTGVQGGVLCISPDERAKVEAVCQSSCDDTETPCDEEQPGVEAEVHTHCIDCIDIPLAYESLLRRDLLSNFLDDFSSLSLIQVTYAGAADLMIARLPVLPDLCPPQSPLGSLSTTVLIC